MGIFGDIMSKIFGQSAKAETPATQPSQNSHVTVCIHRAIKHLVHATDG